MSDPCRAYRNTIDELNVPSFSCVRTIAVANALTYVDLSWMANKQYGNTKSKYIVRCKFPFY